MPTPGKRTDSDGGNGRQERPVFPDGGFETEADVRATLEDGVLFEVAHRTDGDERRVVGVHDEITRPSAKPLDGPPVFRFRNAASGDRFRVELPALVEVSPRSFDDLAEPIRGNAASVVAETLDNPQETLTVPVLVELLETDAHAATAARLLTARAESDPADALEAVPALASVAAEDDEEVREWAIYAFTQIGREYPEELLPAIDVLVDAIATDDETLQKNALSALGQVTGSYPDVSVTLVGDLVELLDSDDQAIRGNAVGLLGDIAQERPDVVVEHAGALAERLSDPSEEVRTNASIALNRAGEADPAAIRTQGDALVAALANETPAVRANACTLIGNAEPAIPVERLRDLRKNDPDEQVRDQASWALDRLSRGGAGPSEPSL